MPTFPGSQLEEWAARVFRAAGVSPDEAALVAHSLVDANLCGHDSHGLLRLPQYLQFLKDGVYRTGVELVIERDRPAALACDAQWGFGQVQSHRLLDLLIPRARTGGVAAGTMRQCGHIGRLGEYAERLARDDLILVATVNNDGAGQRVAPPGGVAPRLGTNPLCIGIPAGDAPVVVDFGTSVVAEGKVRGYFLGGRKPVPEGWLLDSNGLPTCDSSVLYEPPLGSILPVGGAYAYKGFGLAFVLDLLAGGLSGGHVAYPGAPPAHGNCALFVVIDPEAFGGRDLLASQAGALSDYVRQTPRAQGCESITLPGDPEQTTRRLRAAQGVPIADLHWSRLAQAGLDLGVAPP